MIWRSLWWKPESAIVLDRTVGRQILSLLTRSHTPRVQVQRSTIPGSGSGVFAVQPLSRGDVACLYPGVHTPPLPSVVPTADEMVDYVYLADRMTPSGIVPEENAYILNLKDCGGGYLDGQALVTADGSSDYNNCSGSNLPNSMQSSVRLDDNPSACGHLINHNASTTNVFVMSFVWKDVFQIFNVAVEGLDTEAMPETTENHSLPNRLRRDGTPWYLDPLHGQVVTFDQTNGLSWPKDATIRGLCGAAIVATRKLHSNDELFLDYGLTKPYPRWAENWYESGQ